jgi:DNA repair protein RecO (recombination protein O)
MALLATDAVVLHAFDYLETSRIYRLLTREAGVQSVLARGARRSKSRYGTAVDLFAEGEVQLSIRPNRELQTLTAFDVTRSRAGLATSLEHFTSAAAIAELALRFARDDAQPALYDAVRDALDAILAADRETGRARDAALGGAGLIVAQLGFAPTIDSCSSCDTAVPRTERASFSHTGGGTLCAACAATRRGDRVLPTSARDALRAWIRGDAWTLTQAVDGRAHQRLLREFLAEHLMEGRTLRAFEVWERSAWDATPAAAPNVDPSALVVPAPSP